MEPEPHVPDTITICEQHLIDLRTSSADLRCACWTRHPVAMPPAVRSVQEALVGAGFPRDCVTAQNLTRESEFGGCLGAVVAGAIIAAAIAAFISMQSLRTILPVIGVAMVVLGAVAWFFFRSTQCTFSVKCADDKAVERALDIIARVGRGVTVTSTEWRYEVDSTTLGDWATACIERANARAERVAEALGVRVVGIYSYEESFELPRRTYGPEASAARAQAPRRRSGAAEGEEEQSGAEQTALLAGSDRGGSHITVRYRVADYAPRTKTKASQPAVSG